MPRPELQSPAQRATHKLGEFGVGDIMLVYPENGTISNHESMQLGSRFFRGGLIETEERSPLLQGFSTVDQSCERQERELLAYAKRAQYNVIGVWKETASGGKDNRPEREQVMAMAQARLLAC